MYFDDFNVGDTFELESISIDRQKMMEFAHDYDPQKIHTDEEHGSLLSCGVRTPITFSACTVGINFRWKSAYFRSCSSISL